MEKNTGFENKKKKFISLVIGLVISVVAICFIFYKNYSRIYELLLNKDMEQSMLDILGIENYADMQLQEISDFVQKELKQAENHEIDSGEHIYEYDKNGEIRYLRIEKEIEKQSITYYVTDISLWWEEIYQLREKSEIDCKRLIFG